MVVLSNYQKLQTVFICLIYSNTDQQLTSEAVQKDLKNMNIFCIQDKAEIMAYKDDPGPVIAVGCVVKRVLPYSSGADPGQAVSPQVTFKVIPGSRMPLVSARPAVTFPAEECHHPLTSIKLYCLVTEAHRCEQLAQGCYTAAASENRTHDLLIASLMLYR